MVPRALGTASYGQYSYLSAFFTSILAFGDSGSSQAFYNKVSQRPGENGLYAFYSRFALVVLLLLLLFVSIAHLTGASKELWPNVPTQLVWLAALMVFGNWLISVAVKAVDANALTGKGELTTVVVRMLLVITVAAFFVRRLLALQTFIVLQTFFNALLVAGLVLVLASRGRARPLISHLSRRDLKSHSKEFWTYCHPLVVTSFAVLIADVLDRFLLQKLAGPTQQGFLGLGLQIGSVVFIFGGATASLSAREFARSHHAGDSKQLRTQFLTFLPRAYSVTALFGVFFAVQAPALVRLFGGDQFSNAAPATALLCLFPLHQVYGQMGNSMLYATEQTKTMRTISLVGLVLGLAMTLFLLSPPSRGGLGLGAVGVAAKIVVSQILIVNVTLWVNASYLKIPFVPLLARQAIVPLVLGICAIIATAVTRLGVAGVLPEIMVVAAVYAVLVLLLLWFAPQIFSFDREDVRVVAARLRHLSAKRATR